jgi:predicted DNA-binding transcriptional regulator AlpA
MDDGHPTRPRKTLINRKTLLAMIPLSDRAIFNMEKRGDFPRRIVLTSRNVACSKIAYLVKKHCLYVYGRNMNIYKESYIK